MPRRLLILLTVSALGQEPTILRPTDKAALPPGPIEVIARGHDKLLLDGKPLAVTQPAPGVQTAKVTPEPGRHELKAGDRTVEFVVGAADGFKPYRVHPPGGAACATCHTVQEGAWVTKGDSVSVSCKQCHQLEAFPKIHTHTVEVLAECSLCHDPHGSTEVRNLKMPKATACKSCHG